MKWLMIFLLLLFPAVTVAHTIKITGGTISIPDGTTTTDYYNFTNAGLVSVGSSKTDCYFWIQSTGLVTFSSAPTITGPDADNFQVFMAHRSVTPENMILFTVYFTPLSSGVKNATITLNSDASGDQSSYSFNIAGTGVDGPVPQAPDPEFSLSKTKRKTKVNKKTGEATVKFSESFSNQGNLPVSESVILFYYSHDYSLDPDDPLLLEVPVKPVGIPKETKKGPKYQLGKAKLKSVIPSAYGNIIMQVRILDPNVIEQSYRWNTVLIAPDLFL